MRVLLGQTFKSVLGATVGGVPGFLCWWLLDYPAGWAVFIGVMGAFIGFALTLPGVSGRRVLGLTASWIIGHNTSVGWGEKVYAAIAGDDDRELTSRRKTSSDGSSARPPSSPPPERNPGKAEVISNENNGGSSSQSAWWWVAGLSGLFATLLAAFSEIQKRHKELHDSLPKPPSEERLKKLTEEIRKARELDPMVLHTRNVPKPGERDGVELYLQTKLARLRQAPGADSQQIQRLEKSLEYWQERKKERHGQEVSSPHAPEAEKASGIE
jgi:hypothetical protein